MITKSQMVAGQTQKIVLSLSQVRAADVGLGVALGDPVAIASASVAGVGLVLLIQELA